MESGKRIAARTIAPPVTSERVTWAKVGGRRRLLALIGGALVAMSLLVAVRGPGVLRPIEPTGISSQNLVLTPPRPACAVGSRAGNPIVAENACGGDESWRQTLPLGRADAISAFAAPASADVGQSVRLYVSTTARSYSFHVYRVGWYQGYGARLLYTSPLIAGISQPAPTIDPATRAASCANWYDPVTLRIPTFWVSGVYLVKLVTSRQQMRYTLFVVRDDASHAPVLLQMALATYQAYNNYGGRSLYGFNSQDNGEQGQPRDRAYAVSFDRPYTGSGLSYLPAFEGPLIRFLERNGYDMSYMSDVDLVLHPRAVLQHRLLIVGGHDEYWSAGMRQVVTTARDHGVSLAFFSANDVAWRVRLADSPLGADRVVICYKDATLDPLAKREPSQATVEWWSRPGPQPQNSLLGEMYTVIISQPAPLVLAAGAQPYLAGTQLRPGSAISYIVYGEIDSYLRNGFEPPHVTLLAASPVRIGGRERTTKTVISNATIYTAPSGARVFDAGTFYWYVGLNAPWSASGARAHHPSDFERFTLNILQALLGG